MTVVVSGQSLDVFLVLVLQDAPYLVAVFAAGLVLTAWLALDLACGHVLFFT